jgi:hypothetical protein
MAALLILNVTPCYLGIVARSLSRSVRSIVATRISIRLTTSRPLKSVVNRDSISDRNTVVGRISTQTKTDKQAQGDAKGARFAAVAALA